VSTLESTSVLLPFLSVWRGEPLSLECEFAREQFELLVEDLIQSTMEPVEQALRDARLDAERVHEVVLVGGSSRIPLVQRLLHAKFGRPPRRDVNPDEAIALGAAIQAALKAGHSFGERGIMITDVCPYTLGVEVVGHSGAQRLAGMFSPIIPRNTTVPVSRTETYATTVDGQTHVDIKVYQGESKLVKHNTFLDQYTIDGIPPAPASLERIAVTFTYDVNGILRVQTRVLSTGREAGLTIARSAQRMSDGERAVARRRVADEWTGSATARPARKTPALGLPVVAVQHAPVAPQQAPPVAPQQVVAAPQHNPLKQLVAAAERRAAELDGESRARVQSLAAQLKGAAARGERDEAQRLEQALTDLLFELS
jgi:molecular chaperone DnaK